MVVILVAQACSSFWELMRIPWRMVEPRAGLVIQIYDTIRSGATTNETVTGDFSNHMQSS